MSEPQDVDATPWTEVSYVERSQYRHATLRYLAEHGPATPSRIAAATDSPIANISHALTGLRDHGHVTLLVPDDVRKGRIYGVTDRGERLLPHVEEVTA